MMRQGDRPITIIKSCNLKSKFRMNCCAIRKRGRSEPPKLRDEADDIALVGGPDDPDRQQKSNAADNLDNQRDESVSR